MKPAGNHDARRTSPLQLSLVLGAVLWVSALCIQGGSSQIRHRGFDDLSQGSAGDSGANLYVSRGGRVQTINRWDLNLDAELDLVFTQDHDSVYNPDSLIYWGGPGGYQSLLPDGWQLRAPFSILKALESASSRITRLPTQGGGRSRIADLNGDGYQDIVFTNFMHNYRPDQNAYIYWGGSGGFSASNRLELPALRAGGVAVGDLNQDGHPDVVLANRGDELGESLGLRLHLESYIYWGDVQGLDPNRRSTIPTISAEDVAIGDFNGDERLDLAFANNNSQVQSCFVYWGDGSKNYTPQRRLVLERQDLLLQPEEKTARGFPSGMTTLLASDLDGDGLSDLVAAGTHSGVVLYGSTSGLRLDRALRLPAESCKGLAAADLNADGRADLVFANEGSRSGPPPPSDVFWASSQGFSPEDRTRLPTLVATTVQAADFNRDGLPDLLFGNNRDDRGSDAPSYIYWSSPGGFSKNHRSLLSGIGVIGSGVADLDADGYMDILLVSHHSGRRGLLPTSIFWGNSEHRYSTTSLSLLEPGANMEYSIADLDDDGFPDLFLTHRDGPAIWWGDSQGYSPDLRTRLDVPPPSSSSVADLNRDGYLDLLLSAGPEAGRNTARAIIVWGKEGRFENPKTTQWDLTRNLLESSAIADLNRDGHLDLIFPLSYEDYSEIYWGSGEAYGPHNRLLIEAHGAAHAVAADLDQNGWLDLIFTSSASPRYRNADGPGLIYWGGPDGLQASKPTPLEGFTSLDATVADLDSDGNLDIALTNYKSGTTRDLPAFIYWGDGGRGYGTQNRSLLKASSSSAIDALDLNRDGWMDLVVSNHQVDFDHAAGTNIYWGSSAGFSWSDRSHLPTVGVHLDAMVDAGNIYNRKPEWDYVSVPVQAPSGTGFLQLSWSGKTPLGTGLKFQVRTAPSERDLESSLWRGPQGKESFYLESGQTLSAVPEDHNWLQYRAILTSPDGGNSPVLTEVVVDCGP